jgi:hypothetical protein
MDGIHFIKDNNSQLQPASLTPAQTDHISQRPI